MKTAHSQIGILSLTSLLALAGGCTQEPRPDVPTGAMQVASGGKVVAFTAPHDGKAYLRDDTDNRVVYSTDLRRDQIMRFDPALDSVRIDGNTAPEGIASPTHDHSIYFVRATQNDRVDAIPNHSVNENANPDVPTIRVPVGVQVEVQPQPTSPK